MLIDQFADIADPGPGFGKGLFDTVGQGLDFAVKIANMTRPTNGNSPQYVKDWIMWGAGPRASQYLTLAAKTQAIMEGRFTPNIDDVKAALLPVLRHRIITNFSAEADGITSVEVIQKLVKELD